MSEAESDTSPSHRAPTRSPKRIGVVCHAMPSGLWNLFTSLAGVFPVEFQHLTSDQYGGLAALVVVQSESDTRFGGAPAGLPSYVTMVSGKDAMRCASSSVRFGESSLLEECLRGQEMEDSDSQFFSPLPVHSSDELLASKNGHPIWISRRLKQARMDLVALSLPTLAEGEPLRKHFREGAFLRLLPLINFIKSLTHEVDWTPSPTAACFVFDDPNLYSSSYGFINYAELANHARKHNYFVSIATIPLDCWRLDPRVVQIFRQNVPRLSLLIHGNDHTRDELAQRRSAGENLCLLAQALQRWERLERAGGLEACRVMEAPHGAIAEEMLPSMLALDYEAALATPEQVVCSGAKRTMPRALGFDRADLLMGGMPVIPRIIMSPQWRTDVILAAFLRQPIVLAAHHWDAADHLQLLAAFASLVNNLKGVFWASPRGIAQSNYQFLHEGDLLSLKMYSRKICVTIPQGVKGLLVLRPWLEGAGAGEMLIVADAGQDRFRGVGLATIGPIPVEGAQVLEVSSPPAKLIDYRTVLLPKSRWWPVARRILAETRDRSAPWRHRARKVFGLPAAELPR